MSIDHLPCIIITDPFNEQIGVLECGVGEDPEHVYVDAPVGFADGSFPPEFDDAIALSLIRIQGHYPDCYVLAFGWIPDATNWPKTFALFNERRVGVAFPDHLTQLKDQLQALGGHIEQAGR